jgi:serine/threonine-protein kinase
MGEVYRADDLKLGRTVALKFLPEAVERDPARLARLFHEVRTALRVTHPNVCRVYDLGESAGRHFLSMEYVDGEDLASLLRRIGRLPEERAVRVARMLCAGLSAAHAQGVLHRDLKPANVMIDGRGEVKIADFGLAGAAGEITGDEARAGTPAYMSPEQLDGRDVGVRSDVYALGLVLYELFSGQPAFPGRTMEDIARRRDSQPTSLTSLVDRVDPAVALVVDRCLAPDPAERPRSVAAVAAALPGGDPLAAALAAGVTPSPELVAEAGASGGLRTGTAVAVLLATIAGLAAVAFVARHTVWASVVALDLPPAVLAHEASDLVREAGWDGTTVDATYEWLPNDPYYEHLRREATDADRWRAFGRRYPPALLFAYRESPVPLVRMSTGSIAGRMIDPPPQAPGMVEVRLDPRGRLVSFRAVPPAFDPEASPEPADSGFDFSAFLRAAGFDPADLAEVDATARPETFASHRRAWVVRDPEAPAVPLRVEAASLAGRPVSFRILAPWDVRELASPAAPGFWERVANLVSSVWFAAVVVGASVVAFRNVRAGRADHRTAFRFGLYVGVARLLWMLCAEHHADRSQVALVQAHMAWSAYRFTLAYVFYLALEPYARRLWPQMLVSWVRLFRGRLLDARVGRDLLVGVAAGCSFALARAIVTWAPQLLGLRDYGLMNELWSWESLRGPASAVGALAGVHVDAILDNLHGVMLFLVVRVVTGRTWLAIVVVTLLAIVMFNPGTGSPWPYVIGMVPMLALFWLVLFRAGLLSVVLMLSVAEELTTFRVTGALSDWHALPMWLTYGSVAAVAAWGFRAAVAGQPVFRDEVRAEHAVAG